MRWFRRDAARKAGQTTRSRVFTPGGLIVVTVALGALTALVGVPLRNRREGQMTAAARAEVGRLSVAVEGYRAAHYRLPDSIDQLATQGYGPPASIVICHFHHEVDARNFDDHVEFALHHRGGDRALVARYPARGVAVERSLESACGPEHEERR